MDQTHNSEQKIKTKLKTTNIMSTIVWMSHHADILVFTFLFMLSADPKVSETTSQAPLITEEVFVQARTPSAPRHTVAPNDIISWK